MKHYALRTLGVLLALLPVLGGAQDIIGPAVQITVTNHLGWTGSYLLSNGRVEAIVVPAVGRVMQFRFAGDTDGPFWENPRLAGQAPAANAWDTPGSYGGDKAWPAPQSLWDWPPPRAFDSLSVTGRVEGQVVVLTSPVDPRFGLRVVRWISLDSREPVLRITTRFEKIVPGQEPSAPVSVWVVTQLKDPERIDLPVPQPSLFPDGYTRLSGVVPANLSRTGRWLSLARDRAQSAKIGNDAGSLLWVGERWLLRIDSPREPGLPPDRYPDQGCSAEVYTNPDPAAYIELELLGPLAELRVGEGCQRTSVYTLSRRTPETESWLRETLGTAPPFYANRTNLLLVSAPDGSSRPVTNAGDWERRREHIRANLEQVMGPLPRPWAGLPLKLEVHEEVVGPEVVRRKISFQAEPADRVSAYLLWPRRRTHPLPAVLCLHQTTAIGKDEPAGLGGLTNLHYALELARRGYVTLAPDYWTFGDYRQKTYNPFQHGYASGTMKGIWNHWRCLDLLQALPEVDPRRLGAIGHSLGGHNALWLAAFDDRVRVVVSSCGFNTLASYAASPYGGGSLKNYAQARYLPRIASVYGNDPARVPFEWADVLAAVAPRPVFVHAPLQDENFVVDGVRACVEAARPVYRWLGAPENLVAQHPPGGHDFSPEARQAAYEFLDRHLRLKP